MCILLHVINSHHVTCTHCVASSVIMMLLVHVFCFLYSAACQSYSRCSHINVFCFMLSVITRLHHLNHNVAHTYILLLVFCFLYFASYVLLLIFCFLCSASCVLLLMFYFLYSAFCILLLMFYFLCSASCILLLVTHTHAAVTLICVFCSVSLVITVLSVLTVSCHS